MRKEQNKQNLHCYLTNYYQHKWVTLGDMFCHHDGHVGDIHQRIKWVLIHGWKLHHSLWFAKRKKKICYSSVWEDYYIFISSKNQCSCGWVPQAGFWFHIVLWDGLTFCPHRLPVWCMKAGLVAINQKLTSQGDGMQVKFRDNGAHFQFVSWNTFSVVHMKSDRHTCVTNKNKSLEREVQTPAPLSPPRRWPMAASRRVRVNVGLSHS